MKTIFFLVTIDMESIGVIRAKFVSKLQRVSEWIIIRGDYFLVSNDLQFQQVIIIWNEQNTKSHENHHTENLKSVNHFLLRDRLFNIIFAKSNLVWCFGIIQPWFRKLFYFQCSFIDLWIFQLEKFVFLPLTFPIEFHLVVKKNFDFWIFLCNLFI